MKKKALKYFIVVIIDKIHYRNYNIKKDGKYVINPNCIFENLKYAKEEVDRLINLNNGI